MKRKDADTVFAWDNEISNRASYRSSQAGREALGQELEGGDAAPPQWMSKTLLTLYQASPAIADRRENMSCRLCICT